MLGSFTRVAVLSRQFALSAPPTLLPPTAKPRTHMPHLGRFLPVSPPSSSEDSERAIDDRTAMRIIGHEEQYRKS
jgi:hypothetical protein